MKPFKAGSLFEAWKPSTQLVVYRSIEASLDAVRTGRKAMSLFTFPADLVARGGGEYQRLLRLAFDRDLAVVLDGSHVFVTSFEELWRVPALVTLWTTALVDGAWSNAAENQASTLLGYTAAQRARWLEHHRQWQAAWGCATVYALLDSTQRAAATALGNRCFAIDDDLTLFICPNGVLKEKAFRMLPPGITLARVGLDWKAFEKLFPTRKRGLGLQSVTLSPRGVSSTNAALRSNVQFFGPRGW